MKQETKQKLLQNCGWLGVAAVVFYFLHIIAGNILYAGYDPIRQAVSDLTANGAPSEIAARILSGIYGVFDLGFRITFFLFFRKQINKVFSVGAVMFIVMTIVSTVGYTAFPLSASGTADSAQDTMHLVTTVLVVASSIAALVLLAVGCLKHKNTVTGICAIVTLFLMMLGSILTGAVPAILGIAERTSLYSLQVFTVLLAVFMLKDKQEQKENA